jgi:hypothetical protein
MSGTGTGGGVEGGGDDRYKDIVGDDSGRVNDEEDGDGGNDCWIDGVGEIDEDIDGEWGCENRLEGDSEYIVDKGDTVERDTDETGDEE